MMDVIDPFNSAEIFFDGISEVKIIEGVVRIALVARRDGDMVVAARVAIPVSELPDVIQQLVITLAEAAKAIVRPALGH